MFRSVTPNRVRRRVQDDPKWHFEQETEASILGAHFAFAIATKAIGNQDDNNTQYLKVNKKNVPSFRKIFYEDPHINTPLNQASIASGFDAHFSEEQSHWNHSGAPFLQGSRKFGQEITIGPKKPLEFPFVFEKPIQAFQRQGVLRPFSKRKKLSSQIRMEENPPAINKARPISPDRYHLPDPWAGFNRPVCGIMHETSSFKSCTKRFPEIEILTGVGGGGVGSFDLSNSVASSTQRGHSAPHLHHHFHSPRGRSQQQQQQHHVHLRDSTYLVQERNRLVNSNYEPSFNLSYENSTIQWDPFDHSLNTSSTIEGGESQNIDERRRGSYNNNSNERDGGQGIIEGRKFSGSIQIGFPETPTAITTAIPTSSSTLIDGSLLTARPKTAHGTETPTSGSLLLSAREEILMNNNSNNLQGRAKSADNIRKSRTPGHSFSRMPRNTSPKTQKILQQMLGHFHQVNNTNSSVQLEAEIRPLSRGSAEYLRGQIVNPPLSPPPPSSPKQKDLRKLQTQIFDDDLITPRTPLLTQRSEQEQQQQIPAEVEETNQQQAQPQIEQQLKQLTLDKLAVTNSVHLDSPPHLPPYQQQQRPRSHSPPTPTSPKRPDPVMCYSKKSFKELFLMTNTTDNDNNNNNNSDHNPATETPQQLHLVDGNYPSENLMNDSNLYDYFQQKEIQQRFGTNLLTHSGTLKPVMPITQNKSRKQATKSSF